ncbi:tRNA (guanine-N(1)-)-methyltransferase [Opisthorchis viverrini]|uniref:Uncharacterized protein n=2 Tax=Opisthorchis viverrini TaxID=6198 RepID=A0A074ZJA6_OPIVI|nr:hypothetical protein T265_06770 [Opisthorchis viverrini]KER25857.1 hypothetical protein T265_06770 [Opisthorchis viverrini]OON19033.1 tRNA (guanine-N(1)-)-methyltransferase [Opisthorchis viverrini]
MATEIRALSCSASQRKRLAKLQAKKAKRKLEKARKREVNRENVCRLAEEGSYISKRQLKRNLDVKIRQAFDVGVKLCIDCSYESCMSQKECNKFAQQLCRAYGANRKHNNPVSLHLVNFLSSGQIAAACKRKCDGFEHYVIGKHSDLPRSVFDKNVIYLSPDAPEPLLDISDDCAYVIGCLIDEHLMKGKSLEEANAQQCKAVHLPIPEFIESTNGSFRSPVLTVNQVVELILAYLDNGRDWKQAILSTVPGRFLKCI